MDDFYAGEDIDPSGVPTKMVTLNCSLNLNVYNSASMFGIHVTSGPVRLLYSEIAIGVGQNSSLSDRAAHDHRWRPRLSSRDRDRHTDDYP